jgi:hypothetical protein
MGPQPAQPIKTPSIRTCSVVCGVNLHGPGWTAHVLVCLSFYTGCMPLCVLAGTACYAGRCWSAVQTHVSLCCNQIQTSRRPAAPPSLPTLVPCRSSTTDSSRLTCTHDQEDNQHRKHYGKHKLPDVTINIYARRVLKHSSGRAAVVCAQSRLLLPLDTTSQNAATLRPRELDTY